MRVKVISSVCAAILMAPAVTAQDNPENNAERPATTRADDREHGDRARQARMRAFLRSHPHLFRAMRKEADKDGDGKLSKEEREEFMSRVRARMADRKEQRQERRDERKERIEEFQANHPRAAERLDKNGDGELGPLEVQRARKVHDRADRNDDGKVGPLERRKARRAVRRSNR